MNKESISSKATGWVGIFIIGIVLIICTLIARSTVIQVRSFGHTIDVSGAAFKNITSDYATWDASLTVTSDTLQGAYAKLNRDLTELQQFMEANGFKDKDYQISPVSIERRRGMKGEELGFSLNQHAHLELPDVQRVTEVARQASTLIEKGLELVSKPPRYIYTKLNEVKLEMVRAATENAFQRATQLAETTGRKVGPPTSARFGVFQIRPPFTTEVSDYGVNDTSSIQKEIVSTVSMCFLIY